MYVDINLGGTVAAIIRRPKLGSNDTGTVPVSVVIGIAEGVRIVGKDEETAERAVMVRDAQGARLEVPIEDVCSEPFLYSALFGAWLRKTFQPEPEPAPKPIPIESNTAHGVDIPVRTAEAPDAPGIDQ